MYSVIKTQCYPCEWYGGPTYSGEKTSNATCYWWRSRKEAQDYCDFMNSRKEYTPWACEPVVTEEVDTMEWIKEHRPDWLEDKK